MTLRIGFQIKKHRKLRGIKKEELADLTGVSSDEISNWEQNLTIPDVTVIADLCRALYISADELLGVDFDKRLSWLRRLRNFVKNSGKSLDEFASGTGMDRHTLLNILNDKIDATDIQIEAIMNILGGTVDDLVDSPYDHFSKITSTKASIISFEDYLERHKDKK